MDYIQNAYIKILSPFVQLNTEKNRRARHILVGVLFFLILMFTFASQLNYELFNDEKYSGLSFFSWIRFGDYRRIAIISGLLSICMIFLMCEKTLKKVKWSFYIVTLWYLMCVLIIMAGLFHDIGSGFLLTQAVIMICIPALSLACGDTDRLSEFFDIISIALIIFFVALSIVNMTSFPYDKEPWITHSIMENRYHGILHHPNRLAEYCTAAIVASLYLLYRKKKMSIIICSITIGLCLGQDLLSICRISLISFLMLMIAWMIMSLKNDVKVKIVLATILISIVSASLTYEITTRSTDPLQIHSGLEVIGTVHAAENTEEKEHNAILKRILQGDDVNQASSGRIGLWKMCISKITWKGNDVTYAYPLRVLNAQGNGYTNFSMMHNVSLEFAFRCGWPAGILFFLMQIVALVFAAYAIFSRKKTISPPMVFAVMGVIAFVLFGNVEPINEAFKRILLLIYYFSLIPMFSFSAKRVMAK